MQISGVGAPLPIVPSTTPAAQAAAQAQQSFASAAAAQTLQQLEQQTGGGAHGGGGGHGHAKGNPAMEAIDDIAARASLNIVNEKSLLERQAEIEKLQAEMAAKSEQVGEKGDDEGRRRSPDDAPEDDDEA